MTNQIIKLAAWNVNGLRAVMKKGFVESIRKLDADIVAIQETKLQPDQITDDMQVIDHYQSYFNCASVKKGYSGVAVYTRRPPERIQDQIGISRFDDEGRVIEMDFGAFVFFNVYFPNGQMSEERLQYKLDFYQAFFDYANQYQQQGRPVVVCGDFNTAHNEIDLKNPQPNSKRSGFLRIERDWLDRIVADGYVDTFRHLHPDTVKYSWWTYRFQARQKNAGWRIDYFFVTQAMIDQGWIKQAEIDNTIYGSDHCPVELVLTIP